MKTKISYTKIVNAYLESSVGSWHPPVIVLSMDDIDSLKEFYDRPLDMDDAEWEEFKKNLKPQKLQGTSIAFSWDIKSGQCGMPDRYDRLLTIFDIHREEKET